MGRRLERRGGLTPDDHKRLAEAIGRARAGVLDAQSILGGMSDRPALWPYQRRAWRAEMVVFALVRDLVYADRGVSAGQLWGVYMPAEGEQP